jgi:hypothetical protein
MQHYQIQNLDTVSIHNTFTKMCINNIIAVSYNLSFEQTDIFNYQEGPICHLQLWIGKLLIGWKTKHRTDIFSIFCYLKPPCFVAFLIILSEKWGKNYTIIMLVYFFPIWIQTADQFLSLYSLKKKLRKIVCTTI